MLRVGCNGARRCLQLILSSFFLTASRGGAGREGELRSPDEFCGAYIAPPCAELTANSSVALSVRQVWFPNGTFIEEGLWAPGRCGKRRKQGIVRYRLRGTFRDHGAALASDPVVRKVIIDVLEALITPLPVEPDAIDQWQQACPCGSHAWAAFEEVDVLKQCGASCPPFSADHMFLIATASANTLQKKSLCVSPRRSFSERWPSRQTPSLCMEKEEAMQCSWAPPINQQSLKGLSVTAPVGFEVTSLPAYEINAVPLRAELLNLILKEDGTFEETIKWSIGPDARECHFRSVTSGRWQNHGAHPFAPGFAKLHLKSSMILAEPLAEATVCLEEGCAPVRVVLRLLCPCGNGSTRSRFWVNISETSTGTTSVDLHQCAAGHCALSSLFPTEEYMLGGQSPAGELCLAPRSHDSFLGWGISHMGNLRCSGDASLDIKKEDVKVEEGASTQSIRSQQKRVDTETGPRKTHRRPPPTSFSRSATTSPHPPTPLSSGSSEHSASPPAPNGPSEQVTAFEAAGFAGRARELQTPQGTFRLAELGLDFVRSLKIPRGWRVNILAPLQVRASRLLSDDRFPVIRALIFDVDNMTERLQVARPWLKGAELTNLERNLSLEVTAHDMHKAAGAWLRTVPCRYKDPEDQEGPVLLSLFGESSQRYELPKKAGDWKSIRIDDGFHVVADTSRLEPHLVDSIGRPGQTCVDLLKTPSTIEVHPDCSTLSNCSGHGVCRRPHECTCRLNEGWTGKRCDKQIPDGSTSIVCESVFAFVSAPLECVLHARRNFIPIPASPDLMTIKLHSAKEYPGRLQIDAHTGNATSLTFKFWPMRTSSTAVQLFELDVTHSLLADLSRMFITTVTIVRAPDLAASCKQRLEEDDGHYFCRVAIIEASRSRLPLAVPLKLLMPKVQGGTFSRLRCLKEEASGALCSEAGLDVKATASEASLSLQLRAPVSRESTEGSFPVLANHTILLEGSGRASALATQGDSRDALIALGLPGDIPSRLRHRLMFGACQQSSAGGSSVLREFLSPQAHLALAQGSLESGKVPEALQAITAASRVVQACVALGYASGSTGITLHGLGIRAAVEWRLLGQVEAANSTATACLGASQPGQAPKQCSDVAAAIQQIQVTLQFIAAGAGRQGWTAALPGAVPKERAWASALTQVEEALLRLPWTTWGSRLDSESAATARRWRLELQLAHCFGRVDGFAAAGRTHGQDELNITFSICDNVTQALDLAEKYWPQVEAFNERSMAVWKVRLHILRAELFFAADDTRSAMQEVMKGMSFAEFESDERINLDDLFRRIREYRSRKFKEQRKGFDDSWYHDITPDEDAKFYDLLGVSRNASDAEVKKAYRQLALKWHPDKHPDKEHAEEMFLAITEAYEHILADTERQRRAGGSTPRGDRGSSAETSTDTRAADEQQDDKEDASEPMADEGKESGTHGDKAENDDEDHFGRGSGSSWYDPLSRVALPRHCCLPGRLNTR